MGLRAASPGGRRLVAYGQLDGTSPAPRLGGLQNCVAGSGVALKPCCGVFDAYQRDGDVDAIEVASFVAAMIGP